MNKKVFCAVNGVALMGTLLTTMALAAIVYFGGDFIIPDISASPRPLQLALAASICLFAWACLKACFHLTSIYNSKINGVSLRGAKVINATQNRLSIIFVNGSEKTYFVGQRNMSKALEALRASGANLAFLRGENIY